MPRRNHTPAYYKYTATKAEDHPAFYRLDGNQSILREIGQYHRLPFSLVANLLFEDGRRRIERVDEDLTFPHPFDRPTPDDPDVTIRQRHLHPRVHKLLKTLNEKPRIKRVYEQSVEQAAEGNYTFPMFDKMYQAALSHNNRDQLVRAFTDNGRLRDQAAMPITRVVNPAVGEMIQPNERNAMWAAEPSFLRIRSAREPVDGLRRLAGRHGIPARQRPPGLGRMIRDLDRFERDAARFRETGNRLDEPDQFFADVYDARDRILSMFIRRGPVLLRLPNSPHDDIRNNPAGDLNADWYVESKIRTATTMIDEQIKHERFATTHPITGDKWLLGIEVPRIKVTAEGGVYNVYTTTANPLCTREGDADRFYRDRLREYFEAEEFGAGGGEYYHGQETFDYFENLTGSRNAFPVVYVYANNLPVYAHGNANQYGSIISYIFRHMSRDYLQGCVNELKKIHDFTLPHPDLLAGSMKHCITRALLTCYLANKDDCPKRSEFKKELNKMTNTYTVAAKRAKIDIQDRTMEELVPVYQRLSAIPNPRNIFTFADNGIRDFHISCHRVDDAGDYDAFLWFINGNTHVIPILPRTNRNAMPESEWHRAIDPPGFTLGELLPVIGDKRPKYVVTFDYETLNGERLEPPTHRIFTRERDGSRFEPLHAQNVEDYMLAWCIKEGRKNGINPEQWEVDYAFRDDTHNPTHIFLDKLAGLCLSAAGDVIHCWAHNNEFDLPILNNEYLDWFTAGRFKRFGLQFSLPSITPRNNKFIKMTLKAWPMENPNMVTHIIFKDSYKILPAPLKALCSSMEVPKAYAKGELDHRLIRTMEDVEHYRDTIEHYSRNDVVSLMYVLTKFEERVADSQISQITERTKQFVADACDDIATSLENGDIPKSDIGFHDRLLKMGSAIENCVENRFAMGAYTAAGLSRNVLKLKCFDVLCEERMSLSPDMDELLRNAYHGGRVQCFKLGYIEGLIYYYDFTSLYPTTMRYPILYGQPTEVPPSPFKDGENGFAEITYYIRPGTKAARLPVFMSNITGRGLVPMAPDADNPVTDWVTSVELAKALEHGYEVIEYKRKILFKCKPWLRDIVDDLYTMKLEAEQRKDASGRQVAKLLLNSLYGFWALKSEGSNIHLQNVNLDLLKDQGMTDAKARAKLDNLMLDLWKKQFGHRLKRMSPLGKSFLLYEEDMPTATAYQNVGIAAWITALARLKTWDLINAIYDAGHTPLYCDTDSVIMSANTHVDKAFADLLMARGIPIYGYNSRTNQLGCLTNELEGKFSNKKTPWQDFVTRAAICGLKQYALWNPENPSQCKMALKGIPVDNKRYLRRYDVGDQRYFIEHGDGQIKLRPEDLKALATGEVNSLNVLYTGFVTGLSNIWTQPYIPTGNPDMPFKEFTDCTKKFSIRFKENTRKCSLEYFKGPLFKQNGDPFPRDPRTMRHDPAELAKYLADGGLITVGYYQRMKQLENF